MTDHRGWLALQADQRVQCARRGGEVEMARCFECSWLLDVDRVAAVPAIRCGAVTSMPDRGAVSANEHVD
ncbi:MAG TPA: hypothetical protein VIN70_01735 [Candidatus Limnocylindria bacterium]|jgi:hypothetical protein